MRARFNRFGAYPVYTTIPLGCKRDDIDHVQGVMGTCEVGWLIIVVEP